MAGIRCDDRKPPETHHTHHSAGLLTWPHADDIRGLPFSGQAEGGLRWQFALRHHSCRCVSAGPGGETPLTMAGRDALPSEPARQRRHPRLA